MGNGNSQTQRWLHREDIAKALGHSTDWVTRNLLTAGGLPAVRIGRRWLVREGDFLAYMEERTKRGAN